MMQAPESLDFNTFDMVTIWQQANSEKTEVAMTIYSGSTKA